MGDQSTIENVLVDLSVRLRKKLVDLTDEDVKADRRASVVVSRAGKDVKTLAEAVKKSLINKIEMGSKTRENTKFLHTEPHHDDIMLGYLPSVIRHTRLPSNEHHFVCGTSGFNSVSNPHMLMLLDRVETFLRSGTWKRLVNDGYFSASSDQALNHRRRDVWKFLDGVAAADDELRDEGAARRLIANLCNIFGDRATADARKIHDRVQQLRTYFNSQ